jgi:hypothetical protein
MATMDCFAPRRSRRRGEQGANGVEVGAARGPDGHRSRRHCEEERFRQLAALYLLTDTADAYFPRFGFKAVSRDLAPDGIRASREFASACPASAIFMYLPLGTEN